MTLRFCALIWHEYAQFILQIGDDNEAIAIYAQAIDILPKNLMLHFTYAELLESRKRAGEAHQVYRGLIQRSDQESNRSLATIQFLKFLQRTEGPAAMRKEFVIALEEDRCTFHLFLAIASVENLVNMNREAAFAIIDLGMERYADEALFIEGALMQVMKMEGDLYRFLDHAKRVLPQDKLLAIYKAVYPYLLYARVDPNEENAAEKRRELFHSLQAVENEIMRLDPSENTESVMLRRFFLPADLVL
jgi:cleavage stimulation factor subunit 3